MQKKSPMSEYDGLMFLPSDEEDEDTSAIEFHFIKFKEGLGKTIEGNDIGEKYHVVFFKRDETGELFFDETFEAIFADPITYAKGFIGMNLFGGFFKKCENSTQWFNDYLTRVQKYSTIQPQ